jgi:sec-independent protein translocase protein TatB
MNFLGVGPFELLLVLIIATIVLGPERMAQAGRLLGRYYAQYRYRWKKEVDEMTRELRRELLLLQRELDEVRQAAESEVKSAQAMLSIADEAAGADAPEERIAPVQADAPTPKASDREPIPTETGKDEADAPPLDANEPGPSATETKTEEVEK